MADLTDQQQLLSFLQGQDVACPLCQYNLRDLSSPRCPECGRELQLTVGMTEPYLAAWIFLAGALIGSGGFGLFCILMVVKDGWPRWGTADERWINFSFLFHMVTTPVAALAVIFRRRLMRLGCETQWLIAIGTAIVCAISFAIFMWYVN